ncbi:MAG TPA: hypothetical protein VEK33_16300 [Terriglobales bacterium]|nr:hypothetical protein [Terriglobales bacterium]
MKDRKKASQRGFLMMMILGVTVLAGADTVITRNGASYSGRFLDATGGTISFTDASGIQYTFPLGDVQSLVFTPSNDSVTLHNGKVYSGKYMGPDTLSFRDNMGILYRFPRRDIESLVLSRAEVANSESVSPKVAKVLATGTEIQIRTNETIDSDNASPGQLFSAEVIEAVNDVSGGTGIPEHSPAKLLILSESHGRIDSPDLVLDLDSVTINGKLHRVFTSAVKESNAKGFGKNKHTAEALGGGAAIGSLVGAIFGGGRGAAIGAGAGAGGGFLTQLFTRGKQVKVPAETILRFRLERPLVLQPE